MPARILDIYPIRPIPSHTYIHTYIHTEVLRYLCTMQASATLKIKIGPWP
jgi:hypothetical protein